MIGRGGRALTSALHARRISLGSRLHRSVPGSSSQLAVLGRFIFFITTLKTPPFKFKSTLQRRTEQ